MGGNACRFFSVIFSGRGDLFNFLLSTNRQSHEKLLLSAGTDHRRFNCIDIQEYMTYISERRMYLRKYLLVEFFELGVLPGSQALKEQTDLT
jgi:hypothetical protein